MVVVVIVPAPGATDMTLLPVRWVLTLMLVLMFVLMIMVVIVPTTLVTNMPRLPMLRVLVLMLLLNGGRLACQAH